MIIKENYVEEANEEVKVMQNKSKTAKKETEEETKHSDNKTDQKSKQVGKREASKFEKKITQKEEPEIANDQMTRNNTDVMNIGHSTLKEAR